MLRRALDATYTNVQQRDHIEEPIRILPQLGRLAHVGVPRPLQDDTLGRVPVRDIQIAPLLLIQTRDGDVGPKVGEHARLPIALDTKMPGASHCEPGGAGAQSVDTGQI